MMQYGELKIQMQTKLEKVDFNKLSVDYSDIRIENTVETSIFYQNNELKQAVESPSRGAFLRVLKDGNWAFKSVTDLDNLQVELEGLVEKVKLLPSRKALAWPSRDALRFEEELYQEIGCHRYSLKDKKDFCETLTPIMEEFSELQGPRIRYQDQYKQKWFRSSDKRSFYYDYSQSGGGVSYTLKKGEKIFEDRFGFFIKNPSSEASEVGAKLRANIKESLGFIDAPTIEAGKYTVILDHEVTGVFTHESFGHKSEADFMLGDEMMKKEWEIGIEVGSKNLSIIDDGNSPLTTGYVPIDDEGNLAEKTYLIKDGKLSGRLHSTATSIELAESTTGNARAMNFEFEPIVRMTNTYIEARDKSFQDLIAPIKEAIYLKGVRHGMGMSTFTIAPLKAFWVRDGKISEPVKVAVLSGNVFETLKKITDVGNDFKISSSATGGCGKMEQWPLPVADGGPSIVVEDMTLS